MFQGCPLAAILFNCYLADLAPTFHGYGPSLQGQRIPCLGYADDLAIMAESIPELRKMLSKLEDYCNENKLNINTKKTKIIVFRRGPLPKEAKFYINGNEIEIVNQFKYLGVVFTTQLKFYAHVEHLLIRAKAKVGMLFAKTPIKEVKLELVLKLFQCYVLPIFEYNLVVWSVDFRASLDKDINSIFSICLKRWLGVPYVTRSSIVHFLTQTAPLTNTLLEKAEEKVKKINEINLSLELDNEELLLVKDRTRRPLEEYRAFERIPTNFWVSEILKGEFPANFSYRKTVCKRIVDADHWKTCVNPDFHTHSLEKCKCIFCNEFSGWNHICETI